MSQGDDAPAVAVAEKAMVSQSYFDKIVVENMSDFEMGVDDAIEDAVAQLASQQIGLANIVRDSDAYQSAASTETGAGDAAENQSVVVSHKIVASFSKLKSILQDFLEKCTSHASGSDAKPIAYDNLIVSPNEASITLINYTLFDVEENRKLLPQLMTVLTPLLSTMRAEVERLPLTAVLVTSHQTCNVLSHLLHIAFVVDDTSEDGHVVIESLCKVLGSIYKVDKRLFARDDHSVPLAVAVAPHKSSPRRHAAVLCMLHDACVGYERNKSSLDSRSFDQHTVISLHHIADAFAADLTADDTSAIAERFRHAHALLALSCTLVTDDDNSCEAPNCHDRARGLATPFPLDEADPETKKSAVTACLHLLNLHMDHCSRLKAIAAPSKSTPSSLCSMLLRCLAAMMVRADICQHFASAGGLLVVARLLSGSASSSSSEENSSTKREIGDGGHTLTKRELTLAFKLLTKVCGDDDVRNRIGAGAATNNGDGGESEVFVETLTTVFERYQLDAAVLASACSLVAMLCLRAPDNARLLISDRHRCQHRILEAMRRHDDTANLQKWACHALRNMFCRLPIDERQRFANAHGAEEVIRAAMTRHKDVADDVAEVAKACLRDFGCEVELKTPWMGKNHQLKQ